MTAFLPKRFVARCATRFEPLSANYAILRHVHFDGITPFSKGQDIQAAMVNANLDFKKMEYKIKKQRLEYQSQGLQLHDYEATFLDRVLLMKPIPTLLTFEFDNVFTGGKQMKQDPRLPQMIAEYEQQGCKYYQLERGGQVTWHGRGQLTAYLILDLKHFSHLSVRCYVDSVLLQSVRDLLKKNHLLDTHLNENPGVWVEQNDLKICSVGCNVQRAITSYGVGLNVSPDLQFLNSHVLCGLEDTRTTSIEEQRPGKSGTVKETAHMLAKELARLLNIQTVEHLDGAELAKDPQDAVHL